MCVAGVKCASSDGKTLLLWETATGRSKRLDGHRAAVTCLQCLGEERVVSASSDETVRVWMTSTGACLRVVQSLGEAPCSLSVLGNGNLVVGLETARSLSVLDADSYDVLRILHDGLLDPSTVCALDDDRVIAASLDDTVLRLWNTSVEVDVDRDAHSAYRGESCVVPLPLPPTPTPALLQVSACRASSTSGMAGSPRPTLAYSCGMR